MPGKSAPKLSQILADRRTALDPRYKVRTVFVEERGCGIAGRTLTELERDDGPRRMFEPATVVTLAVAYDVPLAWLREALSGKVRMLEPHEHFTLPSAEGGSAEMLPTLAKLIPPGTAAVPGPAKMLENMKLYGRLASVVPQMAARLRLAAEGPDGPSQLAKIVSAIVTMDAPPSQREWLWSLLQVVAAEAGLDVSQPRADGLAG